MHRVEDLARSTGAPRVTGAKVWLGALSHLSAEHVREHFAIEARHTLAAGAVLPLAMPMLLKRTAIRRRRGSRRGGGGGLFLRQSGFAQGRRVSLPITLASVRYLAINVPLDRAFRD